MKRAYTRKKSKHAKIRSKRSYTRKLQETKFHVFFGIFILLLTIKVGFFSPIHNIHQSSVLSAQISSPTPTLSLTPTPSPLPSLTPQAENAGYCITAPSILYHHIEPLDQASKEGHAQLTVDSSYFEQHLVYLSEHGYHAISAEDLPKALINHTPLPEKPIVITIDDGYVDTYTYAFPLAKKYNMILNLMVPTGLLENPGYLSWSQLKEMVNSGVVYAYNHSWSHFSMPSGDTNKLHFEIFTPQKELESHLGKTPAKIFTYPYGSFDEKTIEALKQEGYYAAYSTLPSFTQCDSYLFALRRNHVANAPLSTYGF